MHPVERLKWLKMSQARQPVASSILLNLSVICYGICRLMDNHPMQSNHNDCGVFSLMFASQIAAQASVKAIVDKRVPEFRLYLAHSLLSNRPPQPVQYEAGMPPACLSDIEPEPKPSTGIFAILTTQHALPCRMRIFSAWHKP